MHAHLNDNQRSDQPRAIPANRPTPLPHDGRRAVMLNSGAPMDVAREFVATRHGHKTRPTLLRHRGQFYCWSGRRYVPKDEEAVRALLYDFLDHAQLVEPTGRSRPFEPNKSKVTNILDALTAQTCEDT